MSLVKRSDFLIKPFLKRNNFRALYQIISTIIPIISIWLIVYQIINLPFSLLIKGFLMIIPFVLMVSLIMNLLIENQNGSNPLLEIVLNNNNYFSFILLFLTTTFLAPLFEEVIFRGVLLPILSRDFGIIAGISISAFIFALAHLSISEMPPLLTLGIGLGITRMVSGSLLSSVVMHSLWNGLTFLNLFLLRT